MDGFDPKTSFGYEVSQRYDAHTRGDEDETGTCGRTFSGQGRGGDLRSHDAWMQTCFTRSGQLLDVPRVRRIWDVMRDLPRSAGGDVMSLLTIACTDSPDAPPPDPPVWSAGRSSAVDQLHHASGSSAAAIDSARKHPYRVRFHPQRMMRSS